MSPLERPIVELDVAMTPRPHAHLMAEIGLKEVGPLHHFLDEVWRHLPFTAAGAVSVSVLVAVALNGQLLLYTLMSSMLTMQVLAGTYGLHLWRMAERRKRLYDSVRCQNYLRNLEARAQGVVASERGTVWVITDPAQHDPASRVRIMAAPEYKQFKADEITAGRSLDEVRVHAKHKTPKIQLRMARNGQELASEEVDIDKVTEASGRIDRWLHRAAPSKAP
jgi:hypothetical protein